MRQVERHWIQENHELYSICDELTFKAKIYIMLDYIKLDNHFLKENEVVIKNIIQYHRGLL